MQQLTSKNFGLVIANLLPGIVSLWGLSYFSPVLRFWLGIAPEYAPTVGGFLYVTLASVGAGMTTSAVRFLVMDRINHLTGIRQPSWDFSRLQEKVAAYDTLIEIHYKYYQFYSNMLIAIVFAYLARRVALHDWTLSLTDAFILGLATVYYLTSRDNLRKYYTRVAELLGTVESVELVPKSPNAVASDPAAGQSMPALFRNVDRLIPYKRQNSPSSTTSTRRSPDSHFETKDA